jgi:hypothetical protein
LYSYAQDVLSIKKMLNTFTENRTIDVSQLSKMDALINHSEKDQIRVLSSPLSIDNQRIMFGAIRNLNTSIKAMKIKLKSASERHENPTTAEQALELIESLSNVASYIDPFTNEGRINAEPDEIAKISRILYRKAKSFGFSENQQTQLREAGMTEKQVKSFITKFDNNVSRELGIEEEVKPESKNSN